MSKTPRQKLRVGIVGLGQVGSRFDEEAGRKTIWTHTGAYLEHADRYDIVAATDPDAGNAAAFQQRVPQAKISKSVAAMLSDNELDVVSICTPAEHHTVAFTEIAAAAGIKGIWCEKPLAADLNSAREMARSAPTDIPIAVSYVRRWMPLWRELVDMIAAGAVGRIRSIRVAMPNRLFSIGSHAIDLALMLGGEVEEVSGLMLPDMHEEGEPAVAATLRFRSGALGIVQVTGLKHNLIIEAEVIGDDGRVLASELTGELRIEHFESSKGYDGYRVPGRADVKRAANFDNFSPFVAIAAEIADLVESKIGKPACGINEALSGMEIIDQLGSTGLSNKLKTR
jgi:predicted dehydrogenase